MFFDETINRDWFFKQGTLYGIERESKKYQIPNSLQMLFDFFEIWYLSIGVSVLVVQANAVEDERNDLLHTIEAGCFALGFSDVVGKFALAPGCKFVETGL